MKDDADINQTEDMSKDKIENTEAEDITIEEEVDPDMRRGGKGPVDKLKELKEKIAVLSKEKQEYLDGWQRAKADIANLRRRAGEEREEERMRMTRRFLESVIPVLDSFDKAFQEEGSDKAWREGVERIHTQMLSVFTGAGLERFSSKGELFNPAEHETVATVDTDEEKKDHVIEEVLACGYRLDGAVIRPEKVRVFVFNKNTR
jgi:molecular chaperone GrpE